MKRWEYMITGFGPDQYNPATSELYLNSLGKLGWELCAGFEAALVWKRELVLTTKDNGEDNELG